MFESDCKTVVEAFNHVANGVANLHVILDKCRAIFSQILNSRVSEFCYEIS